MNAHVRSLQPGFGRTAGVDLAVVDDADAAPWQVSRRIKRAPGPRTRAIDAAAVCRGRKPGARADVRQAPALVHLGSCRFRRRSARGQRPYWRTATKVSRPPRRNLHHHSHRADAGAQPFRRRERLLLPPGFRVCHPALLARAAAGAGDPRGNRVLAEFPAPGA